MTPIQAKIGTTCVARHGGADSRGPGESPVLYTNHSQGFDSERPDTFGHFSPLLPLPRTTVVKAMGRIASATACSMAQWRRTLRETISPWANARLHPNRTAGLLAQPLPSRRPARPNFHSARHAACHCSIFSARMHGKAVPRGRMAMKRAWRATNFAACPRVSRPPFDRPLWWLRPSATPSHRKATTAIGPKEKGGRMSAKAGPTRPSSRRRAQTRC